MASELGVQTIQHTNGTDALTISSGGIVTESQKPVLHLSANSSQAFTDGGTTDLTWNNIDLDTVSGWDSVNYRYTPGVAGWYMITSSLRMAITSASRVQVEASVSGTPVDRIQYQYSSGIINAGTYPFTNRLFYLSASDYISFTFLATGSSGTLHDQASDVRYRSRLSIFLVQPA